jgi:hypothetical protein
MSKKIKGVNVYAGFIRKPITLMLKGLSDCTGERTLSSKMKA